VDGMAWDGGLGAARTMWAIREELDGDGPGETGCPIREIRD
jgi:hypothetical protein